MNQTLIASLVLSFIIAAGFMLMREEAKSDVPCPDCNVILITVDTLRADYFNESTAPGIHGFFSTGTFFTNAHSSSPCTNPSVQQILYSRYSDHQDHEPIAQFLNASGYETAAFLSQHQFGFMEAPKYIYMKGFETYNLQNNSQQDRHGMTTRTAGEVTDLAINWLGENTDEKFFLWLHYFDPHDPYQPPQGNLKPPEGIEDGDARSYLKNRGDGDVNWDENVGVFNREQNQYFRSQYVQEIRYLDAQVSRLFKEIEELGLEGETIIVFTSDHGEQLGEGEYWNHCITLHERETWVPFMIMSGGKGLDERTLSSPASTIDAYPTIIRLLGLQVPAGLNGKDLTGNNSGCVKSYWKGEKAAYTGKWKLWIDGEGKENLIEIQGHAGGVKDYRS